MCTKTTCQRPALEHEHAFDLLRQMLLIRRFKEKAGEMYTLGKIWGFLHLDIGEEAVAVEGDAVRFTFSFNCPRSRFPHRFVVRAPA